MRSLKSAIDAYLQRESERDELNYRVSQRTFQRDLHEIGSLYGIYIKFNFSEKYYFIEDEFEPEVSNRMAEVFDMYHALKNCGSVCKFILRTI